MTKLEIIEETVDYYRVNPRGVYNKVQCIYKSEEGAMCAVGRCLSEDALYEFRNSRQTVTGLNSRCETNNRTLDDIMKEEYRGHPLKFWRDLQIFHDSHSHWTKNGNGCELTCAGMNELENLKKRWS